jgi:hypothetical protein
MSAYVTEQDSPTIVIQWKEVVIVSSRPPAGLIMNCTLLAASYNLSTPEKMKDGSFPALIMMNGRVERGVTVVSDETVSLYANVGKVDQAKAQTRNKKILASTGHN